VIGPFRFGIKAPVKTDMPAWRDQVRRIADSGYSTLLGPDLPDCSPRSVALRRVSVPAAQGSRSCSARSAFLPSSPGAGGPRSVRQTVAALRGLDGADRHSRAVMALDGAKAHALAAEVADTIVFTVSSSRTRAEVAGLAHYFRAVPGPAPLARRPPSPVQSSTRSDR
jgi:hypothetical protein